VTTPQNWPTRDHQAHPTPPAAPPHQYGPGGATPPAKTIDGFTIWTVVSAIVFIIAGSLAFVAAGDASYTDDLAFGVIFAVFSGAGFIGMILSRIGAAITRAGAGR
jgi:hypothetical protein